MPPQCVRLLYQSEDRSEVFRVGTGDRDVFNARREATEVRSELTDNGFVHVMLCHPARTDPGAHRRYQNGSDSMPVGRLERAAERPLDIVDPCRAAQIVEHHCMQDESDTARRQISTGRRYRRAECEWRLPHDLAFDFHAAAQPDQTRDASYHHAAPVRRYHDSFGGRGKNVTGRDRHGRATEP